MATTDPEGQGAVDDRSTNLTADARVETLVTERRRQDTVILPPASLPPSLPPSVHPSIHSSTRPSPPSPQPQTPGFAFTRLTSFALADRLSPLSPRHPLSISDANPGQIRHAEAAKNRAAMPTARYLPNRACARHACTRARARARVAGRELGEEGGWRMRDGGGRVERRSVVDRGAERGGEREARS